MNDIQMLQALVGALRDPQAALDRSQLKKALTAANGFTGIYLEPAAKLLLPVFARLRNRFPSSPAAMGAPTSQWRMQLGYGSFAFGAAASFGTSSNGNGAATSWSATTIAADYKPMSINGGVDWQAIKQAQGWDNAMAIDTKGALSLLMRLEELEVLFANEAAITMSTPTMTASTTHAGPTFANGTWNIRVTAITGQGTITNASANSNVGESDVASASVASGGSGCDFFDVNWAYVPGALGYKVYIERTAGGGTYYLCRPGTELRYAKADASGNYNTTAGDNLSNAQTQYVTVNRVQIYAIPPNTQPTSTTGDNSANSNVFEGVTAWCTKNTIYGQSLTGSGARVVTDMAGLPLTTLGTGIKEFDSILQSQWITNQTSPTLIIGSPNSIVSAGNRVAASGNNSQLRLDIYKDRNSFTGGLYMGGYVNKFASGMAGMQTTVDLWAHPYFPDGTFLFLSEDIPPETVPYAGVSKAFDLNIQTPYTYFELGRTNRSFPYDVFYEETLRCFWPTAQSAIVGARVDS